MPVPKGKDCMSEFQFNPADLVKSIPLMMLLATGLILMISDAIKVRTLLPWLTALGLIFSIALAIPMDGSFLGEDYAFNKTLATGGLASYIHIFMCLTGLMTLFFIKQFFDKHHTDIGEVYALIVFAICGMVMLANANDLIVVFIGLETMSVCLYILAGLFKKDIKSNESGMKYFLLGAFATGFLLYGMAMIYGVTGTTNFSTMDFSLLEASPMFYPSIVLVLIGFLFKVAAFPFHSWTPDVYQGTPTPLAGFMATGAKSAAFIAFGIFIQKVVGYENTKIINVLLVIAVITMIYGNFMAVRQTNFKRLLAYSSIAHTGYVMLGLCAGKDGFLAVMFYMFIYSIMNIGAFGMIGMVEDTHEDTEISSWKGIGTRLPWFSVGMSVFLFSLAGIPPLAGFMSKYMIFITAIEAGLVIPAILGILTSVAGAYYYLNVMVSMYFHKAGDHAAGAGKSDINWQPGLVLGALLLLILILGIYPSALFNYLESLYNAAGFMSVAGK